MKKNKIDPELKRYVEKLYQERLKTFVEDIWKKEWHKMMNTPFNEYFWWKNRMVLNEWSILEEINKHPELITPMDIMPQNWLLASDEWTDD